MDLKEQLSILNHFLIIYDERVKNGSFLKPTVLRFEPRLMSCKILQTFNKPCEHKSGQNWLIQNRRQIIRPKHYKYHFQPSYVSLHFFFAVRQGSCLCSRKRTQSFQFPSTSLLLFSYYDQN